MPEPGDNVAARASYCISPEDHTAAMLHLGRPKRALVLTFLAIALVGVVLLVQGGDKETAWLILLAPIGGIAGAVVYWRAFLPILSRRYYNRSPLLQEKIDIEQSDDGFSLDATQSTMNVAWGDLVQWRESAEYIYVFFSPKIINIIPKRIADQGFDIERLRANLTEHVGPPRR